MNNQNKSDKNGLAYGITIGTLVGIALGCWLDNLATWMSVGLCVGVAVGATIDNKNNK